MNYLVLMTFAGSLLFLCYLCWDALCGRFLTQNMKYKALAMVLLVYAIPWVWLRRIYGNISDMFLQRERAADGIGPVKLADISTEAAAYMTQDYRLLLLVVGAWMSGAFVLLVVKLCMYFCNKRKLISAAQKHRNEIPREIPEETIKDLKRKLSYKRNLQIYLVPENATLTLGIVKPIIFVQKDCADDELNFILGHEMTHIIRRDLLLKLLLELVCCLHWFNPLIYILKRKFEFVCETSCDERVLMGCTKAERGAYAKLPVRSSAGNKRRMLFGSNFKTGYKSVEERVNLIMRTREIKRWGKMIAACSFALMLFANSLTALAYPEVHHVENASVKVAETSSEGDIFWGYDRCGEARIEHDMPPILVMYDEQFIDNEGNVYPVESVNPHVICFKHNIESGYYTVHYKNDTGGCTIDVYESTRCTKCNTIWVGDLDHTVTYVKCTH